MQVQILNLYHTMLFNSPFRLKAETFRLKRTFGSLLSSRFFVENLLLGLNARYSYVREQYVSFISGCLPLLAEYVADDHCAEIVSAFLAAYYYIIKGISAPIAPPPSAASDA